MIRTIDSVAQFENIYNHISKQVHKMNKTYTHIVSQITQLEVEFPIKTENSFLALHTLKDKEQELISKCVESVKSLLIEKPEVIMFGKVVRQRRSVGFFSNYTNGYKYTGRTMDAQPLSPVLEQLLVSINKRLGAEFNGILVNKYENGEDCIGKHTDDEKDLDNVGVVSVSFGAERTFRIREKITEKIVANIPTQSNKIIQMGGMFQKHFTHEIPVEKKIKECRYSFTFRKHC